MAIYVKFGDIKGSATHQDHKDWLDITSMQWGVGRAISTPVGAAANRESSEPSISEVTLTKNMDVSSAKLLSEACSGKTGKEVEIDLVTTGDPGNTYAKYKLHDALISGYSVSTGGDRPSESLSINFTKITFTYTPYDKDNKAGNPITVDYDISTSKSG